VDHDSCYMGRYMDVFDQPRAVLEAAGGQLKEMDKTRSESFCCGAGGGRILADETLGTRISEARVHQAVATSAPMVVSNCPFCLTMFEDGIKTAGCEEALRTGDLAEIVAARLATKPTTEAGS
jgi:Fe-S oxidoreductase